MLILSMDLGKFKTVCCYYETTTREYRFVTIETKRNHVENLFSLEKTDLVVMEACGPSGWISDICHEKKLKTIVCSTNDEAWAWKNTKRKTDRDDALKLAKMAMMGMLTSVHVPQPQIREQRAIIKYRKTLDQRVNRIKNGIRSLFANHGIEIDTGKRAWCTGRVRIDSFRKPLDDCDANELWKGQLDLELTQLDDVTAKMKQVEDIALARKLAVIAWAMMRDQTNWDSTKLLPDVPPEEVPLKVKRPEVRPAGELHSGAPKYTQPRGRRPKQKRTGGKRRAPVKT